MEAVVLLRSLLLLLFSTLAFASSPGYAQVLSVDEARAYFTKLCNDARANPLAAMAKYGVTRTLPNANLARPQLVEVPGADSTAQWQEDYLTNAGTPFGVVYDDAHVGPVGYETPLLRAKIFNYLSPIDEIWVGSPVGSSLTKATLDGMFSAFMGSTSGHFEAIMNMDVREIGIGFGTPLLTQKPYRAPAITAIFGRPTIPANTAIGNVLGYSYPETGWWWDPNRPGSGIALETNANGQVFFASFTYGASGEATWSYGLLSPLPDNRGIAGPLTLVSNGTPMGQPIGATTSVGYGIGNVRLACQTPASCTIDWPFNTPLAGRSTIVRYPINGPDIYAKPATPSGLQTGWYWNPAEPGRGYFVEVQNNQAFMAAFTYTPNGAPTWIYATNALTNPNFVAANALATSTANGAIIAQTVGSLSFQAASNTSFTLNFNATSLNLTRYKF